MGEFHGNQHTDSEYNEYEYEDLVEGVRRLATELDASPTTRDAEDDDRLPSIRTMYSLIEDDWSAVLEDAGIESANSQIGAYDSSDHEDMVADLRRVNDCTVGENLTMREYDDYGEFATSTVKKHLGSWAAACEAADIDCGTRHGKHCTGPNGNQLDSRHELGIARYLDSLDIDYETHVRLGVTLWTCDFYLPSCDLWIEVDGYPSGERPNRRSFTQKLGYYAFRQMDFAVVKTPPELAVELRERDLL